MTTNPYAEWEQDLDKAARGERIESTTTPKPGFYKRRMVKNGPFVPVWIYPGPEQGDTGPWLARRTENGLRKEVDAHAEWERCYGRPISREEYEYVAEKGGEWFGTDRIVGEQMRENAKPGSNEPSDEAEILKDQIDHALIGVEKYSKLIKWTKRGKVDVPVVESFIKDDDTFAKAQTMRSRLLELHREGEKAFEKEKAPVNKEAARIGARWRFREDAEQGALIIRSAMETYQTAKLEAARKADEADKAAAEAEVQDFSFTAPPPAPPPPPPVQDVVKGSYGRAATLGQKRDFVQFTDQDKFYDWVKGRDDVKAFLAGLAQKAIDANRDPPGVETKLRATVS